MDYPPQRFTAPDGTEMVVLRAEDWGRLCTYVEDVEDVRIADERLARIEAGEGTMPGKVLSLILIEDLTPLAGWRRHRGMSRADLAKATGVSEAWVSQIEAGDNHGSPEKRGKLAAALEAPIWAVEDW